MPVKNPMESLYQRLNESGFNKRYVRQIALPDWWDDSCASNPTNFAQATVLISRSLGLDIRTIDSDEAKIAFIDIAPTKFKKEKGVSDGELQIAKNIAMRVACFAFEATPGYPAPSTLPSSGSSIRDSLLQAGADYVNLERALDWCWDNGIPVLHTSKFPTGAKKMDGLAARINGCPAVVISRNDRSNARLLFILAHELGHIIRGHLDHNGIVLDEKISDEDTDNDEKEANEFAVELLTGHPKKRAKSPNRMNAGTLAQSAIAASQQHKIDPGVIALNYAWHANFMPVGMAALKMLEPGSDAPALIRKKMLERLDLEKLSDEKREVLLKLTGADHPN